MAAEFITAAVARIKAASSLDAAGDPYLDAQPSRASYPYIVIHDSQPAKMQLAFDTVYLDNRRVIFKIFHTAQDALVTYQTALHTLFDKVKFTPVISSLRVDDFIADSGVSSTGVKVFEATSVYDFIVQGSF